MKMSISSSNRLMSWVKAALQPGFPLPCWSVEGDAETCRWILQNRLGALLDPVLARAEGVPGEDRMHVARQARDTFVNHERRARGFRDWMAALPVEGWCMLRGPALGVSVYRDPVLRPYSDLDLLVRPEEMDEFLVKLDSLGFTAPRGSFPDAYYRRHHFHLQRVRQSSDFPVLVEVHWALDHQWTFSHPSAATILTHGGRVDMAGVHCPVPEVHAWWMLLALHLCKHLPALPTWAARGEAWRLVAEGELLHLLDLALLLPRVEEQVLQGLAEEWGCQDAFQGSLHAIAQLWPERMGNELAAFTPRTPKKAISSPTAANVRKEVVFRPARCGEVLQGVWPDRDTIRRLYGSDALHFRALHAVHFAMKALHAGLETLWWSLRSTAGKRSP